MLSIDSFPSNEGEEGEEFVLHSSSSWSSLDARGGIEGGDMYDSPIYGFGLRDYFRNNPRLGRADGDVATTRDNNPSNESEDGVVRSSRGRRRMMMDNDNIDTGVQGQSVNRKEVARRPMPRFKGKEPSSSSFSSSSVFNINNNNNNRGYPSSSSLSALSSLLQTPPVTAPYYHQQQHNHHHHHHRDTGSSSSKNKTLSEFTLSEYPLYRRDSGLGAYTAAASSTAAAAAAAAEGYDPLSHLMEEEMESVGGDKSCTTMILGPEWEAFRRIGLGVGG